MLAPGIKESLALVEGGYQHSDGRVSVTAGGKPLSYQELEAKHDEVVQAIKDGQKPFWALFYIRTRLEQIMNSMGLQFLGSGI